MLFCSCRRLHVWSFSSCVTFRWWWSFRTSRIWRLGLCVVQGSARPEPVDRLLNSSSAHMSKEESTRSMFLVDTAEDRQALRRKRRFCWPQMSSTEEECSSSRASLVNETYDNVVLSGDEHVSRDRRARHEGACIIGSIHDDDPPRAPTWYGAHFDA